jgi:hypothetical protein
MTFLGTAGGRPFLTVLVMFVSYVLRVRPEGVRDGRFAGEIEAVATGQRFAVRSIEQLVAFVLETVDEEMILTRTGQSGQGSDL